MRRGLASLLALVLLAAVFARPGDAASLYQPGLAFRVLATPHFRIYYHQGGEHQARRLARIAESVRTELTARTRLPAPSVTHVVLANQDDDPNGLATPLPYPTVRLSAAWPGTSDLIANTDDWLRAVFVHEYAHVIQADRTRGWAKVARSLLGRSPISFPNLFLPQWQIEGYAILWESRLTGLGRLNGGDAASIVASRARAGMMPLDQANGGVVAWPGGNIPYLEGAWFYDYLAKRFGEESLAGLNDVTAGRFPYFSAPAFRQVFKQTLGDLWRDFQRGLAAGQPPVAGPPSSAPRRLTDHAYWVTSPRLDASGRRVFYSLRDPHGFPSIRVLDMDGAGSPPEAVPPSREVADRFGGRLLSVHGDLVFYDELELRDNVAWRSDLRVIDTATGRNRQLTSDGRLLDPSVSPDGRTLAAVKVGEDGTRGLAFHAVSRSADGRVSLAPTALAIPLEPGATFGAPRWSPDGRRIAAERRVLNGPSEIVVFDVADGVSRVVASAATGRVMTPAWMPGGTEILFAADRDGEFQVYSVDLAGGPVRQVTDVVGGATFPDVSTDGKTLVFVGAAADGCDVYSQPIDARQWATPTARDERPGGPDPAVDSGPGPTVEPRAYSPWPTLLPRSWTPLADTDNGDLRLGAGIAGTDVLARHVYAISALWRVSGDNGAGPPSRPDWSASYSYDRWRPSFFVAASDSTSRLDLARPDGTAPLPATLREQDFSGGVSLPFVKVRHTQVWQAAFSAGFDTLSPAAASSRRSRAAFRGAWAVNTGKEYGWSISREDGVAAALTSEQVRAAFGADGDADAFTGEVRAYWRPGRGHAVLAARVGYGSSSGDEEVRRLFYLGGSMPAGSLIDFGSDALRMLRGFDDKVTAGTHIAVASVEWRQPVLRVERGWGTVPILLRALHGTVFLDAGEVWERGFRVADLRTSLGAEAALDLVAGFALRVTLTIGAAWTHDPAPRSGSGGAAYFRIGPSF
jgi:Tol biopolymer transport system component